jgi:FkbM family methyltransferase
MRVMSDLVLRLIGYLPRWLTNWVLRQRNDSPILKRLTGAVANSLRDREVIIRNGIGKGLFINVGESAAAYTIGDFKSDLQSFIGSNLKVGAVFYDIGANVGFFSLLAARIVGPNGKVICFEPLPANLKRLIANVKRNEFWNVKVLPLAVGVTNEERLFQVSERPTWGKLKDIGSDKPDKYLTDIKVTVRRLDDLLKQGTIDRPDYIKIDVEGAEVEVIEGAMETLLRYGPTLMVELHGTGNLLMPLFTKLDYCALPLNDRYRSVAEAHWNSMILAFPATRARCFVAAESLAPTLTGLLPSLATR